jgi:hypothetical protein
MRSPGMIKRDCRNYAGALHLTAGVIAVVLQIIVRPPRREKSA